MRNKGAEKHYGKFRLSEYHKSDLWYSAT